PSSIGVTSGWPLAACDAGVEEVPLQHGVVLREDWDDHGSVFRALALVDGRRIGRHQHVKFSKSISNGPTIKARNDLTSIGVDIVDVPDVAVVDLLSVAVLDLHDLLAGGEGPSEPLHFSFASGGEGGLQLDLHRPCTD